MIWIRDTVVLGTVGTGLQISRKIYFAQIYFMNAVCVKLARMFLLFIQIVEIPALSAVGTF